MDETIQTIKSLIKQDIDAYHESTGEDCSEEIGGVLLGYVCTAHLDSGAFEITALMGLGELEKKLGRQGKKIKFSNIVKCIPLLRQLSIKNRSQELEELKGYASNLAGYKD